MGEGEIRGTGSLHPELIAPCGMDCGVCSRAFRGKDRCGGCRVDGIKPKYCQTCRIRNCDEIRLAGRRFCFECPKFPCSPLRRLDTRYRTRYRMSVVENLGLVQKLGLECYVELERQRWRCRECDALTCVHNARCIYCGRPRS